MEALTLIGAPPFFNDAEFERVFGGTITGLNRVLRSSYVVGKDGLRGPIGKMIAKVRQFHFEGNRFARDWEAFRIGVFAMQMEKLERINPDLFATFRRNVRKISNAEYFGFRFEVQTAMMLIQAGMPFRKRESPDFEVGVDDVTKIFLECASTNLAGPQAKDVSYKISSAINNKAKKPYCNTSTALFLDFTNIFYRSVEGRDALDMDAVASIIDECARKSAFGAVCACSMINLLQERRFALGFPSQYHAENVDPNLIAFLDKLFLNLGGYAGEVEHMVPFSM